MNTRQPNSGPTNFKLSLEKNWERDGLVKCKLIGPASKVSDLVNLEGGLRIFPLNPGQVA